MPFDGRVIQNGVNRSMAQSPTGLQEPSMDELLASIREIIEESSAAAEMGDFSPVDSLDDDEASDDKISDALSMAANGVANGASSGAMGGAAIKGHASAEQNPAAQEDVLAAASLPIHDAMKALAARIGLKKQAGSEVAAAKVETPVSPFTPHIPTPFAIAPSVASAVNVAPAPAPAPSSPRAGGVSAPKTQAGQVGQAKPISPQIPMSLSVQASTQPAAAPKQIKPLAVSPAPLAVKTSAKESLSVGHVPLYPQFRTLSSSQQGASSQKGASSQQVPPSQPIGQQAGMMAVSAPASTSSTSQSTMTKREETMSQEQKLNEVEQGFSGEFEQSAEGLLRPYIAGWLEEHFQNLLEKILREEIQRLMQQSIKR